MKFDADLVRDVLLRLEESDSPISRIGDLGLEGYDDGKVLHHCYLLMEDGLIDGIEVSDLNSLNEAIPQSLTMEGHRFVQAIRQDTFWQRIKAGAKSVSLAALKAAVYKLIDKLYPSLPRRWLHAVIQRPQ